MKRILVVMTTSRSSRLALDEALAVAKRTGVRLRLARVLGLQRSAHKVMRAEAWLEHLERKVPEELRDGTVALVGPASLAIRHAAEVYSADMVVLGAPTYAALVRSGLDESFVDRIGPKLLIVRPITNETDDAPPAPASKRPHDAHPLLEATTLAAAASGAVVGAFAGLPGVFVGAGIGSALGMVAGRALEAAEERTSFHDHELDDEIGVTHGSVGLGAAADISSEKIAPEASLARAGRFLDDEHHRLEQIANAMLIACAEGDWQEMRAEWSLFEQALRIHMATEERAVLPMFQQTHPEETEKLLADHDELRRHLDEIAVAVELHSISPSLMKDLTIRLQEHGRAEEALLYPWVDVAVEPKNLKKPLAA